VKPDNLPKKGLNLLPFAEHALEYIEAFFTANGVALPDRRYIAPGVPAMDAWDCEQLMIGCVGITNGGAQQGNAGGMPRAGSPASVITLRGIQYGIQLVRCVPKVSEYGQPPDPAEVNKAGRQQLIDMGLISQAVVNLASSPPSWVTKEMNVDAGEVAPLGPSGGYAAIESAIRITGLDLMTGNEVP
jgi:hypothetical protein